MSKYYEGSRRFALGGKGWTVVLGSMLSLSYLRWEASTHNRDLRQGHQDLKGEDGKRVRFDDEPNLDKRKEMPDPVEKLRASLHSIYTPNLYHLAGLLTAIWVYRCYGSFNKLMIVRYSDIAYQIRRPDVLANKITALRYLAVGGAVVPCAAFAYLTTSGWLSGPRELASTAKDLRSGEAVEVVEPIRSQVHNIFRPYAAEFAAGPFATFARNIHVYGQAARQEDTYDLFMQRGGGPRSPSSGGASAA